MASNTTPTSPGTLLEAVNTLLAAVRLTNVMSLNTADMNEDAASAKEAIDKVAREVQQTGYEFNTDWSYAIDPDANGYVNLPENTLKVRVERTSTSRYVRRGLRLYDSVKHTFAIGETVTVDLVVALPFEDLPESFKLYITAVAARRWCLPKLPAQSSFIFTQEFVNSALKQAEQEDQESADLTLPDTSPHFANMRRGRRSLG